MKTYHTCSLFVVAIALFARTASGGILLEWDLKCGADALDDVEDRVAFWVYKRATKYMEKQDFHGHKWIMYPEGTFITDAEDVANATEPEDLGIEPFLRARRRLGGCVQNPLLGICCNDLKCQTNNSCRIYCVGIGYTRRELNNGKRNENKDSLQRSLKKEDKCDKNNKDIKFLPGEIRCSLKSITKKCVEKNLPCACALQNYNLTVGY